MLDLFTLAAARKYTNEAVSDKTTKQYVDTQISSVMGGLPPSAYDTIKEIGDYLDTHENAYQALLTVLQAKVDEPDVAGAVGQILSLADDGSGGFKTVWRNETDYSEATISGGTFGTY